MKKRKKTNKRCRYMHKPVEKQICSPLFSVIETLAGGTTPLSLLSPESFRKCNLHFSRLFPSPARPSFHLFLLLSFPLSHSDPFPFLPCLPSFLLSQTDSILQRFERRKSCLQSCRIPFFWAASSPPIPPPPSTPPRD